MMMMITKKKEEEDDDDNDNHGERTGRLRDFPSILMKTRRRVGRVCARDAILLTTDS